MVRQLLVAGVAVVVLLGCQTSGRGIHSVPTTRDYGNLDEAGIGDAERAVAAAHRRGAPLYAPYEYYSATHYLRMAREERRARDREGARDYAGLAQTMAQTALRTGALDTSLDEPREAQTLDACREWFAELKARYLELDRDKAIQAAPILYAQLNASLSRAEHEIQQGMPVGKTAKALTVAQTDLDVIVRKDTDEDGVPDLGDASPWGAEDMDGFEDQDGAPDLDNDGDGVPDTVDAAPNEPETVNKWHDDDGAPDELPTLDAVRFGSGSTQLSPEAQGYLRGMKEILIEWPELKLRVAGHCNPGRSATAAMDLSRRRAEVVQEYLVGLGVADTQLVVLFHGDSEPCPTATGRTGHGRVELTLE